MQRTANKVIDLAKLNMDQILRSEKGFLIRPFVNFSGIRNGYRWNNQRKGQWIDFMNSNRKQFRCDETGKYLSTIIYCIMSNLYNRMYMYVMYK